MSSLPAFLRWPFRPRAAAAPQHSVVDAPTEHDLLGYRTLANPVAKHILSLQTNQTPLTIGIYGQWGSGKTSFLRMVDGELRKGGVRPIWFQAWKYEREDNLWAALIQTIVGQGTIGGSWWQRIQAKLRLSWRRVRLAAMAHELTGAILNIVARALFIAACAIVIAMRDELGDYFDLAPTLAAVIATIAGIAAAKPDALLGLFSAKIGIDVTRFTAAPSYRQHIAFLDDFTSELRSIIRIAGAGKPVVVVIDDLDRCLPEKALQVLEAMKLFLDVEGAVFLLAVDREVIQHAVAFKYRGEKEQATSDPAVIQQAESYLEKLIHLSFTLLPLRPDDVARLIRGVCDEETARWADMFAAALPPNPRTVKRTLQMFVFMKQLAHEKLESGEVSEPLLAKMIVMYEQCREIYRDLPRFPYLIHDLEAMARDPNHAIKDPALDERVKQLLLRYPLLRELLVDPTASFAGNDIEVYLRLLRSVQTATPATPAPAAPVIEKAAAEVIPEAPPPPPADELPIRIRRQDGEPMPLSVEALMADSRIIVRGPRDSGKTALLRTLHAQVKSYWSSTVLLPVYLHLRDVSKMVTMASILNVVTANKDVSMADIERGTCWFLIDGISGSRAEPDVLDGIGALILTYPSNRYLLATRLPGLDLPVKGFVYYDLVPPTQEELTAYIERQLPEGGKELAQQLVVSGLATSPRLVRLAVANARAGLKTDDVLELFVGGTLDKLESDNLNPTVARRLLIYMSRQMGSGNMIVEPDVLTLAERLGLPPVETLRYLAMLSRDDIGLLVQPRPGSYSFSHDAVRDFFRKIA